MKLFLITVDPVQQVAAEPDTLDELKAALRPQRPARTERPAVGGQFGSLTDLPLVADPVLPRGFVYLRPHPRRPTPSPQEATRAVTVLAPEPADTGTGDEGLTHTVCCDEDTAICGTDVAGQPFVGDEVPIDCVVCLLTDSCPTCGRRIVNGGN